MYFWELITHSESEHAILSFPQETENTQRTVYVSPCQFQLLCLLVFAFPSLVSPKQTSSFHAPATSVNTSEYYTPKLQKMNLWSSLLLLLHRLNIFIFPKASLICLITELCISKLSPNLATPCSIHSNHPTVLPNTPPPQTLAHLTTIKSASSNLLPFSYPQLQAAV